MKRLILASASPRRRELLANAGFAFEVAPAEVDESYTAGEDPAAFVERLALAKAAQVAQRFAAKDDVVVLGADTVVVADGEVLGKPASADDARAMLHKLSGIVHRVITGVALAAPGTSRRAGGHEVTRVYFRPLTEEEIAAYVATGEPLDKAGAYAAQGQASRFVTRVEGCYFNVVGLPVALVDRLLREWERS